MIPTIVVPMAGNGQRFADAGYEMIKPLILCPIKPMIEVVVEQSKLEGNWVFVVQKEHREKYNLDAELERIRPGCKIVDTGGGVTQGAACSVLLAEEHIDPNAPLIILNSDNILWLPKGGIEFMLSIPTVDGVIATFVDDERNPKWSFVALDEDGFVTQVAEKDPISEFATAGLYVWKRGGDFIDAAYAMIAKDIRVNGEFYVSTVYNENIANGQKIAILEVIAMIGVGTPEDLRKHLEYVR